MAKIGRNQPCPCGSGKKYKHCHGRIQMGTAHSNSFDPFQAKLEEIEAADFQRQKQQGLGRPIVSNEFKGRRIVGVGSRIYHSPTWKTFHDFLREYIWMVLGKDWARSQRDVPEAERHQIMQWYDQSMRESQRLTTDENGLVSGPMTGAQRAFLNLSYNLYLIAHHSDPAKSDEILNSFVRRLKSARQDDFIGKLFETYASAALLKAGFEVEYENEKDGTTSHVEFVATHPSTQKKFAVEVKARNRLIGLDGPVDEVKRLRVAQKLKKALRKSTDHTRLVFIEVNIPDAKIPGVGGTWIEAALQQIRGAEQFKTSEGQFYPPAYVIVTNHSFHNNLEASDVGLQAVMDGFRMPDFGMNARANRFKDYLEDLERHSEMLQLFDSIKEHQTIPITFDGEIPEFALSGDDGYARLRIGNEYMVPNADGELVAGVLTDALVREAERKAEGIYRLSDGTNALISHELTDKEISAWRQHPETFFGRVKKEQSEPQNWLELAEFLFKSYENTDKEKLLKWMENHEDIEALRELGQRDLAILYCERVAWSIWNRSTTVAED